MLRRLNQAGDTIVEVMVVLAVLGFAVSISYATANRSLLASRAAQENAQATALLEGQLEALRALTGNDAASPNNIFRAVDTRFCIDVSDPSNLAVKGTGSGPTAFNTTKPPTDYSSYPALPSACVQDQGGYKIYMSITVKSNETFILKAYWDDVQGEGLASTMLAYRVHKVSGF